MARKRFGQHFLHQRSVIDRLVAAIGPQPGQRVVEIGPGEGALTASLLDTAGHVTVVEVDRDLAGALQQLTGAGQTLEIHTADALAFDFSGLADGGSLRLVGNLPYNISTPLIFHLLAQRHAITDMHFMLQREVVDRLAAGPGSKTYGRLSVMVQAYCDVALLFRVAPGAFRPPPAVDSAVVRLTPRGEAIVPPALEASFAELVGMAFNARRKTLRNTLASRLGATAIEAAGVDPGARPEALAPSAFAALARAIGDDSGHHYGAAADEHE